MALSFEEFERLAKVWNNGQQIKEHEMQKQNMPAPKYREVPSLKTKRSERTNNDDMKSLAQSNDLMASQKSVRNTNNTLKQTNPLNKSLSTNEKPKSVSRYGNNTTQNTLDMSKAPASNSLKSTLKTEKAKRSYVNTEEVDKYLDPSYKLSGNETKRAKQMIDDYFDNNEKARKALQLSSSNPYQASKVRAQMSDRERKEYDKMTSLINKSSNLSAYTYGALNIVPFGNTAMNKLGELAGGDSEYNYSAQKRNVKEQSPIAYGLGDMTSKLAAYATLSPALEKIPALTNFTNGLGTMATGGNAIGGEVLGKIMRGTLADVALDTLPTEVENYKNGMRGADLVEDAAKNVLMNTLFNTGGEAASQLFTALKARKALKGAADVAEDAVRTTPKVNELDAERALADSRQSDWDALRAEMNRKPTNLEMEQASNVDEMENLRRALAEQNATKNVPEVPRVGEEPSLVTKENPAEEVAKATNPNPNHWSNWKVGDEVDVVVNDEPGITPYRERGVVSKVEGDHAIVDIGNDEHHWVDDSTADLFEPVTKDLQTAKADDKIEYWQKLLNDKKTLNSEIKKAEAMYKSNGMEMDKEQIKMELQSNARRHLKEAGIDPNVKPTKTTPKKTSKKAKAETDVTNTNKVMASDEGLNPRTVVDDEYKIEGEVPTEPVPKSDLDYDLEFDTSMPERDATKVSKGYTNTGKNANGWNEAEYNKYTDPNNYTYESKQELESVNRATRMREDEGYDAFRDRVINKELGTMESEEVDGLMMDWRETIQEARELEAMGEDASELWERSNTIFRKIQQEETHNAQALQALAKWSRNTPEGMLMQAEQIVNKKIQKAKPKKSAVQKELDKILKKHKDVEFSADFQKKFLEEADSIFKMSDLNTTEAKDAMASLGKMVASELPVKLPDKVTAFLMDNMLGNFRTLITRNAGGNVGLNAVEQIAQRPLAAGIDKVVAKKTGVRTQAGLTKAGLMEYMGGFKKGLKDELHDMKTGLHTARTGENTMKNAIDANRHVFKEGGIMDKFDSLVKNGLSIGDRPFYEAVYNQTLGDYNRLRAMGQMGEAIQNLSDADFDKLAKTAANMNALSAVYQNDSTFAKAMLDFKNAVGELSEGTIGVDLLSQFTMPFVKTPANVVDRAIDYSPIGIVRNIIRTSKEGGIGGADFDQNRFVNEASRNILGTGLMGGAAVGAKEGLFSGSYSDNKEEKQAQKRSGMQEYALNVPDWVPALGGKQMDISWLPIVGSNAVAAAAAVDAFNKGEGNFIENVGTGLKAGGKALLDQSAYQGLQRLFGSDSSYDSDAGLIENALNTVKQGAGQAIPSLVRQLAQVTDPYQRDLANSNGGNYEFNSVVNSIPIARELLLAPKVGDNGELMRENQGRGVASKILEDMILPGKLTEVNENPLDVEAKRLSEETGNTKAYRPKASRSDVDTENHKLSNAEWVKYEQDLERATSDVGRSIMGSDYYYKASDPEKENILDNAYQDVKNAIKSEYSGKEIDGGAKIYKEAGGGEAGIKALTDYYQEKAYNKEVKDAMGSNSEWATQLYERNDPKELSDYKNAKALADAYGVNLTETNYLDYATYGADKLKQELNYAKRAQDIGVNNNDLFKELTDKHTNVNEIKRAFDDITSVTSGVDEYNRDKHLSFSKKNYDIYKDYGLEGLKDYAELAEENVSYDIYRQAKQAIPSLTKSDYVATFHYMDGLTGSDPDGAISQKELLAYFNNQNVTANKAKEIWRAYGKVSGDNAWKSVPVLKYNKKTGKQEWSTTKKK